MKTAFRLIGVLLFTSVFVFGQLTVFEKKGKYGLKRNYSSDSVVLHAEFDSIIPRHNEKHEYYWIASKGKSKSVYERFNGNLIIKNQKVIYYDGKGTLQVLDSLANMRLFINEKERTDFQKYSSFREIPRDLDPDMPNIDKYEIKKDTVYYYWSARSREDRYRSGKQALPKGTSNAVLINNEKKLLEESEWEDSGGILYTVPDYYLSTSYIILKKNGKYGVWNFMDEKQTLPYKYAKITSYYNYILLEKKGLKTFYPNIGKTPKYKNIEPYIANFARFEYPNGKKGWVDRSGKEYFDGE